MPKVTLLADGWKTYSLVFGTRSYTFTGGVTQEVPPAVALACRKRKDRKGKPLFSVEGLEEVVVKPVRPVKQNVVKEESLGAITQRRLVGDEVCHS